MSVRAFACSRYAAENLMDAVHLRASSRGREPGPGDGPPDAVVRDMQRRGPPGHPVLRTAASSRLQRSGQRVDDATGRFSASETTARATATAAGWSAARTVTMLTIWLAVCALTMLAALADAACSAATANSAGFGVATVPVYGQVTS